MFKRILIALLALNIVGFAIYSVLRYNRQQTIDNKHLADLQASGAKFQNIGVVSQADLVKLNTIAETTESKGTMSSSDFDFALQKSEAPLPNSTAPQFVHFAAAVSFLAIKSYAPGQKEKIMGASLSLLQSKNQLDQRTGLMLAAYQRDPSAISYALPLLNSPYPKVRKKTTEYLAAVGYHPG